MRRYERVSSAARILERCLISLFVLSAFGSNGLAEEQPAHSITVESVAFSPNGRRVLTGNSYGTTKLWDTETGKLLRTFEVKDQVYTLAFHPDGSRVLAGQKLWDVDTGKLLRTFGGSYSSALSPDGSRVLTGGGKKKRTDSNYGYVDTAQLWETDTGELIRTFAGPPPSGFINWMKPVPPGIGHESTIWSVAFSPDGAHVLTGSMDRTVKLWDSSTGELLRTFVDEKLISKRSHVHNLASVAFSPDGTLVASGSVQGGGRLWDTDTGKLLRAFFPRPASWLMVAFSPDGAEMLTPGSCCHTARLWETGTGKLVRTFTGHSEPVKSVAFSPDGSKVLTGSFDGTAKLWETDTGKLLRTFK